MAAEHRFNNDLKYRDDGHEMQRQLTPSYILEPVRAALGGRIGLDPCTEPDNPTGADVFYTSATDGAKQPWDSETIFVNPPYSKARERWVEKCIEAGRDGRKVVLLIPAATDTRIFQRALASASAVTLIRGRVKFGILRDNGRQQAASHPSALINWGADASHLTHLGTTLPATAA